MAPRRGGGSSSSSSGGSSGISDYDPNKIFQTSDVNAMYALLVCASLLLVSAIIALIMVWNKSWLQRDGRRKKARLIVFVVCLVSIIICQAVIIANLALTLQGPNDSSDYSYYNTPGFLTRPIVRLLFNLISLILFFGLVLVEVSRLNAPIGQKSTTFEKLNFAVLFVLSGLCFTIWVITTMAYVDAFDGVHSLNLPYTAGVGLSISTDTIMLIFATFMVVRAPKKMTDGDALLKAQNSHLRAVTQSLWVAQALFLAIDCIGAFVSNSSALTISLSLSAASDVFWMVLVIEMALLAWDSHKLQRAGLVYESANATEHPAPTNLQYWPHPPVHQTSMSPPAQPMVGANTGYYQQVPTAYTTTTPAMWAPGPGQDVNYWQSTQYQQKTPWISTNTAPPR